MEPLASSSDLAAYTGGRISDSDPRVGTALDGVSTAIRRYCGWHVFPEVQETVLLDGPGGRYLTLPSKHVTGVYSILDTGLAVLPTTYRWSEDGSVRLSAGYWSDEYRAIEVTYSHGYDDVDDLRSVVLAIAARQLASPMGAVSEAAGGVTVKWSETTRGVSGGLGILDHEYALIDPYRIESI